MATVIRVRSGGNQEILITCLILSHTVKNGGGCVKLYRVKGGLDGENTDIIFNGNLVQSAQDLRLD